MEIRGFLLCSCPALDDASVSPFYSYRRDTGDGNTVGNTIIYDIFRLFRHLGPGAMPPVTRYEGTRLTKTSCYTAPSCCGDEARVKSGNIFRER